MVTGDVQLDCDEYYEVVKILNIGERAYNLRGIDSKSKVFVREGEKYAFVEDELERWLV
jgi:hypothetical protein